MSLSILELIYHLCCLKHLQTTDDHTTSCLFHSKCCALTSDRASFSSYWLCNFQWPHLYHCFSLFVFHSTNSLTVILAMPFLPYQWAELISTSCLAANLTRCGLCENSCIETVSSAGTESHARPPFFFILTVSKGSITQSSWRHGGVWSFRVCFCCGVSVSRLMQGKGRFVPILEKAGIGERVL